MRDKEQVKSFVTSNPKYENEKGIYRAFCDGSEPGVPTTCAIFEFLFARFTFATGKKVYCLARAQLKRFRLVSALLYEFSVRRGTAAWSSVISKICLAKFADAG
ncbi:hypothetical protein EVAR_49657_1 [Eumeta japonica]|uniref:Uncharacterized protein n=1 Tax=Eumeta variegata TaxID=151549 RepID=A0A4C1YB24_EUMVA|nr:hypothetical protein EVAR_49657_1 [Eumeta japonica]